MRGPSPTQPDEPSPSRSGGKPRPAADHVAGPQNLSMIGMRQQLAALPIFSGFTDQDLAQLERVVQRRWIPAGFQLMADDDPADASYIVLKGIVKVLHGTDGGEEVILSILGPGDIVGEMSLLDNEGRSASVVAIENSVVLVFPRRTFLWCLRQVPDFSMNILRLLTARLRFADDQISTLSTSDVHHRMVRVLIHLCLRFGVEEGGEVTIPFRLTQSEFAAMVGASRVRVNQVLGELRRARLIRESMGRITVTNMEALSRQVTLVILTFLAHMSWINNS